MSIHYLCIFTPKNKRCPPFNIYRDEETGMFFLPGGKICDEKYLRARGNLDIRYPEKIEGARIEGACK